MSNLKSQNKFQVIKEHRSLELAVKKWCFACNSNQKSFDCEVKGCPLFHFRPWANKSYRKNKQFPEATK